MQIAFCDWEPCPWLKKLVELGIPKGSQSIALVVNPKINRKTYPLPPFTLNLWYCPFCGVRIHDNKDILEWIAKRIR